MGTPRIAFGATPQGAPPAARRSRFRGGPGWGSPLQPVRRRIQVWFHNRLRRTDTLTLTQRNVYILPTRAGWMLALTLLVLLVASINFQLNLGYLLTFLLAGSALVGMHVCHNNLRGLTLHLHPPEAVHAHQAVVLEAVDRIAAAARAAGLHAGMHCTSAEYAREMIARGFDFVTVISDETLLSRGRAERAKLP